MFFRKISFLQRYSGLFLLLLNEFQWFWVSDATLNQLVPNIFTLLYELQYRLSILFRRNRVNLRSKIYHSRIWFFQARSQRPPSRGGRKNGGRNFREQILTIELSSEWGESVIIIGEILGEGGKVIFRGAKSFLGAAMPLHDPPWLRAWGLSNTSNEVNISSNGHECYTPSQIQYSPDINPLENLWAKSNIILRKVTNSYTEFIRNRRYFEIRLSI